MSGTSSPKRSRQIGVLVMAVLAALLFVLLPLVLLLSCLGDAQRQYRVNQTYLPTPAKIITSTVTRHRESKSGVHFTADVTFEYDANGKQYHSSNLAPADLQGDEDWAYSIVGRYQPMQTCRAYYDPIKPEEAVLMLGYYFTPYFDMLAMGACLSVGLLMSIGIWSERERQAVPADNGWFKLFPKFNAPQRLFIAKICTAAWYATALLTAAHYFHYVPPPHRSWLRLVVFAMLGLIPVAFMVRYLLLTRNLGEAQLFLSVPVVARGQDFNFKISQAPLRPLTLSSVQAQFRCIGIKKVGKSRERTVLFHEEPVTLKNQNLHPGQPLDFSGTLKPPPDSPLSGRDPTGKQTWINWEIALECKIKGSPAYETKFPVIVDLTPIEVVPRPADLPLRTQVQVQDIEPPAGILSKGYLAITILLGMRPVILLLAGIVMMGVSYPVVFHDHSVRLPILFPVNEALIVFIAGVVITLGSSILGLIFPNSGGAFLRRAAIGIIRQRPGAIVNPEAKDSLFVDVVPRTNWNRFMLENASDVGFLSVDLDRREIRFEGDRQRYRIPAESICSCTLEKSLAMQGAAPGAPGYWMVFVRAYDARSLWEAPFAIRPTRGRGLRKFPTDATQELHARINSLLPKQSEQSARLSPQKT